MFERFFGKMKTESCWKILVECVDDQNINEPDVIDLLGVYTTKVPIDYDCFNNKNDSDKKKEALELLMDGIRIIAKNQKWNLEPFENVYSKIRESNYINEWVWKKVKNDNEDLIAEIYMQHNVKAIDIYILIKDRKGNELTRKKIISEKPHEFAYANHLGKLMWVSSTEVVLVNKNGDEKWSCRYST